MTTPKPHYPIIQIDTTTTQQQVFTAVATHLLKQRDRCSHQERCLYRSGSMACAVGCLLTDDEARAADSPIPGVTSSLTPELIKAHSLQRLTPFCSLLQALQGVHDHVPLSRWKHNLRLIAAQFNLEFPTL